MEFKGNLFEHCGIARRQSWRQATGGCGAFPDLGGRSLDQGQHNAALLTTPLARQ